MALLLVAACSQGGGADGPPDNRPDGGPGTDGPPSQCQGAVRDAPYRELTSDGEVTVPAHCPDCPGAITGFTGFEGLAPTATTATLRGSSSGASGCDIYVEGSACGVIRTTAGTDPDGTGAFASTVPLFCGENIVRVACHNAAGARVLVRRFQGTQCANGGRDLRLTLSWDDKANDMELHLVRPGGRINDDTSDCTWFTCMERGLEWGDASSTRDNPTKDIDNTGPFGPENVYLEQAPPGVYDVLVEYWGHGEPRAPAEISIAIREMTVATLPSSLAVHEVWHVGQVRFPEGQFVELNRLIECETQWQLDGNQGCAMPLPQ